MTIWTDQELRSIAAADDLHIAPFRDDGRSYGTPTWIWSVVVDKNLYVRPYNGPDSSWYRAAVTQRAGRIRIAGTEHDVTFASVDATDTAVLDAVDQAYRSKYTQSPYLPPMLRAGPRSTTILIIPTAPAGR